MTRKDIEKRCREAMEQNLPDKDALWMRIESSLPAQSAAPAAEEPPKRKISVIYRTVAAAACFLFVAGGVMLFGISRIPHSKNAENAAPMTADNQENAGDMAYEEMQDDAADEMPKDDYKAGLSVDFEAAPAQENFAPEYDLADEEIRSAHASRENTLTYAQLQVPQTSVIASAADRSKLTVSDDFFAEETVLGKTQAIVRAEVLRGTQDETSGLMCYTLAVQECYGSGEKPGETLTITTSSPYLMEQEHVYYLPLHYDDSIPGDWELSYPDAPQIEATQDGRLLYHSGWTAFWENGHTPVLCEPQTDEDCYYDKMYLTDTDSLDALLDIWGSAQ